MLEKDPKQEYSREDVRRMLGLSPQQLRSWERRGLIGGSGTFSFSDLTALRTLQSLREARIPPRMIGRAVDSLKHKIAGVEQPLAELKIVSEGRKIAVHLAGERMEAISGQMLFDFDTAAPRPVSAFPQAPPVNRAVRDREAEAWFQRGLELEEVVAPIEEVIEAYQKCVQLNPDAAGAWVNLGTLHYRLRRFREAEKFYRHAIEADAKYPLAHFNLGNLYDEEGRVEKADQFYKTALRLNPHYADAHFNLALLCERRGDALQAVYHWKSYLKLDQSSSWAAVARKQLDKLREATLIKSR